MPKELVPAEVKPTGNADANGNMGYNIRFSSNEEAFMLAKKAPEPGVTEYGEIVDATSKAGKSYKRFYRRPREEWTGSPSTFGGDIQPENSNDLQALEKRVDVLEALLLNPPLQNGSQSHTGVSEEELSDYF